jgi:hypothetical protein
MHSICAMKGIRLFIYFGRKLSTHETEDGPAKDMKTFRKAPVNSTKEGRKKALDAQKEVVVYGGAVIPEGCPSGQ